MVHIYYEFLRDLHSGKRQEGVRTIVHTSRRLCCRCVRLATLSQIERALDRLGHVNQDQTIYGAEFLLQPPYGYVPRWGAPGVTRLTRAPSICQARRRGPIDGRDGQRIRMVAILP
jgi:hypothetical protein